MTDLPETDLEDKFKVSFAKYFKIEDSHSLLECHEREAMELPKFRTSEECARKLDDEDPIRPLRRRFYVPEGTIYVDGNSLGLLSKDAERSIQRVLKE